MEHFCIDPNQRNIIVGILILIVVGILMKFKIHNIIWIVIALLLGYLVAVRNVKCKENFTKTPSYVDNDFEITSVAPTYDEEWSIPPPSYDIENQCEEKCTPIDDIEPQNYPYGQILSKTNMLPMDEHYLRTNTESLNVAKSYANDYATRNDVAFRDNMTKIFKKSLRHRFKNNCNDNFSPFHSS